MLRKKRNNPNTVMTQAKVTRSAAIAANQKSILAQDSN